MRVSRITLHFILKQVTVQYCLYCTVGRKLHYCRVSASEKTAPDPGHADSLIWLGWQNLLYDQRTLNVINAGSVEAKRKRQANNSDCSRRVDEGASAYSGFCTRSSNGHATRDEDGYIGHKPNERPPRLEAKSSTDDVEEASAEKYDGAYCCRCRISKCCCQQDGEAQRYCL